MSGKNIGIVTSHVGVGGGAEKSAITLGESLIKTGHCVSYLTTYSSNQKYQIIGEEICLGENLHKKTGWSELVRAMQRTKSD